MESTFKNNMIEMALLVFPTMVIGFVVGKFGSNSQIGAEYIFGIAFLISFIWYFVWRTVFKKSRKE